MRSAQKEHLGIESALLCKAQIVLARLSICRPRAKLEQAYPPDSFTQAALESRLSKILAFPLRGAQTSSSNEGMEVNIQTLKERVEALNDCLDKENCISAAAQGNIARFQAWGCCDSI